MASEKPVNFSPSWEQGLTGNESYLKMLRGLVSAALVLFVTSALPLRPPARILSSCQKLWKGCPEEEEGGSRLGEKLTGFSEAMAMYEDKSGSASAWTGENGLDRAASKGLATSAAATTARRQLYKNHGADGSKSDESGSASARAGENGLDRAASKGLATSVAARNTWLQLYKDYGTDGFDSETIKGAAKAELDLNKYQVGGMRALHAIEQDSYVQYENYRSSGSDAGANSETVTAWAAGRASVLPQVDQLSTSAARPRVKEVSATPVRLSRSTHRRSPRSRRCSSPT